MVNDIINIWSAAFNLVKAEIVQFDANETTVCKNDVVALTCSADGNPMVHAHQLFENNVLVINGSGSIVWRRTMSTRGVFVYRCVANNTIGTDSKTVNVTVNGKLNCFIDCIDYYFIDLSTAYSELDAKYIMIGLFVIHCKAIKLCDQSVHLHVQCTV